MQQLNHVPVHSQALVLCTGWCTPIKMLLLVTQPFPKVEIALFYFIIVEQGVLRQDLSPVSARNKALCQSRHTVYRGVCLLYRGVCPPALQAAAAALGDLPRVAEIWDYTVHLQQILPPNTWASRSEWRRAKFKDNILKTK